MSRATFRRPNHATAADDLPKHTGAAAPARPTLTPPPFHCTRLPCGAITPRGGSARGNSAASPCMRLCGGWKGQELRRTARAPPARAATPRPAQVTTRIAGADCKRSHPRLRSEPERAAQTRRRGAGDSESANRRAAPKGTAPKGAASRPASGPRRGADPARGFPDTDRRSRILRTRMSDRVPPGRAEHDSRLPSPAPPIRFTTDSPACHEMTLLETFDPIPSPRGEPSTACLLSGAAFWPFRPQSPPPACTLDNNFVNGP